VSECSVENALFLKAVNDFRNAPSRDLTMRALNIVSTFIEPHSMLEVKITDKARAGIKNKIDPTVQSLRDASLKSVSVEPAIGQSTPDVPRDMFDEAYSEIYALLAADSWTRFQNSFFLIKMTISLKKKIETFLLSQSSSSAQDQI